MICLQFIEQNRPTPTYLLLIKNVRTSVVRELQQNLDYTLDDEDDDVIAENKKEILYY